MPQYFLISQVVDQLRSEFPDISVSKIRYLEGRGLLKLSRSPKGYRHFSQEDVEHLHWVLTQQSKNFLPLEVIRQKLGPDGKFPGDESSGGKFSGAKFSGGGPRNSGGKFSGGKFSGGNSASDQIFSNQISNQKLNRQEFIIASGLRESELSQLEQHKLLKSTKEYDQHDLEIAGLACKLMLLGLEPRHLRTYALAAEKEVALAEQLSEAYLRSKDESQRAQGQARIRQVVELGLELKQAILLRRLEPN